MRRLDDHRDRRGWVVNPFEHLADTGEVSHCHAFSIEPGCSRGGHRHSGRNEEILVLAGRLEVRHGGAATVLDTGQLRILDVQAGTAHSLHNHWDRTAVAVCWSSRRRADSSGPDSAGEADRAQDSEDL